MDEKLYYGRGKDCDNKKLIAFLDEVFFIDDDEETKRDFMSILPKIYHDEYRPAYNNFVVQEENGDFRAAVGNFYIDLDVCGEAVKACCIGNVAVGVKYRSMGYMVDLMEMSVKDMQENGTDLAYLGGQRQRYGYFGFEASGVSYNFEFNKKTAKHIYGGRKSTLRAEKLDANDLETIKKIDELYRKNVIKANRPLEDYYRIITSWRHTPYVVYDGDEFAGYFLMGYSYEWISECGVTKPEYYGELALAALEVSGKDSVRFNASPFDKEKHGFFTENSENISVGGCESMLVYNYEKVIRAYLKAKASYTSLADGELTVLIHGKKADEKLRIAVKNNEVTVEKFDGEAEIEFSHFEATRAFFSNFTFEREKLNGAAQQWFPLPAFIFSADQM
ncbi:MAG: GNAT family N-acetyltransferase [Clostridia bacterium]|nr:GNAT family N-acetyltransferase [Clostridia bacterium]